ncbi:MAG: GIY-YIG nuclease family protein [Candidatus Methanomethylophilaceae archaeon]|jgi:hypothetical protein
MEKDRKKELIKGFFQRKKDGGIVAVCCSENGRRMMLAVPDIRAYQNRFEFSRNTGNAIHVKLQEDWQQFGGSAFYLEVIDTLERKADQTDEEYASDLSKLLERTIEKTAPGEFY